MFIITVLFTTAKMEATQVSRREMDKQIDILKQWNTTHQKEHTCTYVNLKNTMLSKRS